MVFRSGVLLIALVQFLGVGCISTRPFPDRSGTSGPGLSGAGTGAQVVEAAPDLRIRATGQSQPGSKAPASQLQLVGGSSQAGADGQSLLLHQGKGAFEEQPPVGVQPADAPAKLRELYTQAASRYAGIDSYIVRLRRREQVNGRDKPEELLLMKFRKQPWSVYFKWLGKESSGREVVYVKGAYENKIHTLLAAGDMPLMPAGKRVALPADNPLVRSSSRHSIEEAGIGVLIDRFGALVQAAQKGGTSPGTLRYLGLVARPEFEAPGEGVEQTVPPGSDPQLQRGGRRLWIFDREHKLPCLLITEDETGHEVEYYCYDRFQFPVRLDDDDFNPDRLWASRR
jgi:hypothetical protein